MPEVAAKSVDAGASVVALPTLHVEQAAAQISLLRLFRPGEVQFSQLSDQFGLPWPSTPNRATGSDIRVLWLAPDIWALVGPPESEVRKRAAYALAMHLHHVSGVSEGRAVFDIRGTLAPTLLNKGCSLDFHPRQFGVGQCAQSLLAQVPILIEPVSASGLHAMDYRIYTDVSYSSYLRAWFSDAALEYS